MNDSNHSEPSEPQSSANLPKLYSLNGIGFATFFGSLLAGFFLLAANYHALGMKKPALAVIGAGLVAFCLYFVVVMNLIGPASMGPAVTQDGTMTIDMTTAIFSNVGQVLFLLLVTHLLQGNMLTTFRDELGGQFHSVTRSIFLGFVAYLGLASVCLIILSVFGLMPLSTDPNLAA
jgi:hypothetical protein